jgi:hypothetical protein
LPGFVVDARVRVGERVVGTAYVVEQRVGIPTRTRVDLRRALLHAALILGDWRAAFRRFDHARVAVGVAREVREHVPAAPTRQRGIAARHRVVEVRVVERAHEPLVRVARSSRRGRAVHANQLRPAQRPFQ